MKKTLQQKVSIILIVTSLFFSRTRLWGQEEPTLPLGLDETGSTVSEDPALPEGLLEEKLVSSESQDEGLSENPLSFTGFWESRFGMRLQNDPFEKDTSMGETRFQLQVEQSWPQITFHVTNDFLYDPVLDQHEIDLGKGGGFIDLREANVLLRPGEIIDLKIGRQILTWGTGDLVFINDLFPKDWNAFFIGRDTEYLKAPSDAIKAALFTKPINIDVVYTPRFDPDRFIDGRRISFFNNPLGRRSGRDVFVQALTPDSWFKDDEFAWRLYQNILSLEVALYGYRGYWKSPAGMDATTGQSTFPLLSVYGGSARGAIWQGIGNIEIGYYDSEDDPDGDHALIRNSEFRFLAGYEQEVLQNFTVGFQYYVERLLDHDAYLRTLPTGSPKADKNRHVLTLRLTQLMMNQDLSLTLFTYYSSSDEDAYLRPKAHYKVDDFWSLELGGNLFFGKENHTFFGQFEKNNNVYLGVRYGF